MAQALAGMTAPAVSAAAAAAAFVAQIFADVATPDPRKAAAPGGAGADAASTDTEASVEGAPAADAAETEGTGGGVPTPAGRPGENLAPLQGQNILILGLGASGLAMARWCVRCGAADVTVADTRDAPPQRGTLHAELPQVRFVAGAFDERLIEGRAPHAIYRSPGLSPVNLAALSGAAQTRGIPFEGELALFAMALRDLRASHGYAPAVLAISGTNGKTTVTSLAGKLVDCAGKTVAVAGNIGPTLLDTLGQHIDANTLPEVWVLELSSFQLDGVTGFEPTAAAVLNITQDHLDWHGSLAAYAAAKARIFGQGGLMLLNREDPEVMGMLAGASAGGPAAGGAVAKPASRQKPPKVQVRPHVTFGGDMPQRPGDFGLEIVNGMAWLVRAQEADETARRSRVQDEELYIQRLMPADALRIRGRHNAVNALAALALAQAAGCALGPMLYGLREYRGEPHRVEPIGLIGDVEYFDDSKGTNVGATVAALTGLGAERRLVVILGGDGKGQDFSPLAAPVSRYARAVLLIGRDAPQIRAALRDAGVALLDAQTLPEAVALATQRAHAGDAVLMSPACASFDMFNDYEHRARVFCEAVQALANDRGQDLEGSA
ncbi:UDP-N-acetylmuramoyl-L-alanine--D-glutamate ligase [Acidovorax sp. SUPP3334]|uniref:Mur ligase family protein n=1 Tax=Acidovorax sp. SUPP3334 TaxID=2920881 RepID=UPI0024E143C6|nr:UDP-N-acetylmuramoyl-L-alanine--D-glutamate ligase [Acidovorax sp. SUPP3334]